MAGSSCELRLADSRSHRDVAFVAYGVDKLKRLLCPMNAGAVIARSAPIQIALANVTTQSASGRKTKAETVPAQHR